MKANSNFYFFLNTSSRKLVIHTGSCSYCNQGQGPRSTIYGRRAQPAPYRGQWRGSFATYEAAYEHAQLISHTTGLACTDCGRCKPKLAATRDWHFS